MNILMYAANLNVVNGGVTYALVNRANHLKQMHNVHIFTHNYCVKEQVEIEGANVTNLFDYISSNATDKHLVHLPLITHENESVFPDKINQGNSRVFVEGVYKQYRQYEDEQLVSVDFFGSGWNRVEKAFLYNQEITRLVAMNAGNKPAISRYLKNGKCFLTTSMNNWEDVLAFDHVSGMEIPFKEMKVHYLKKYITENNIDTVFIDKREDVALFLELKKELGVKLFFFLHNNHYHDYTKRGATHSSLDDVKNNLSYFEKIIVLTKQQKQCLDLEWGASDKTVVISNVINYYNLPNTMENRLKYVSIGRYAPVKNMSDMIKAIRIVSEKYPEVSLDLFGYGPDKEKLIKEAEGLNVTVNDFCTNAQEVMAKYSGYLLTSKYEGQAMVLLEAYDSHTPIFTYNCDFGPSDIVNEFDNGILIRSKKAEELAERIIDYIEGNINFEFKRSVDEDFSIEDYSRKINAILEESNLI